MRYALRLFMILSGFGILLGSALPALAQPYCWCRHTDETCTQHGGAASSPTRQVTHCGTAPAGSTEEVTNTYCNNYCSGRTWRAAFCDEHWIPRTAEGNGTCPSAADATAGTADTPTTTEATRLYNPLGDITIPEFIARGIRAVVGIIGALALLMMVAGGVVWMTAGDSDRIKMAKSMIVNSAIGLLLIFFSYSIISIFFSILRA